MSTEFIRLTTVSGAVWVNPERITCFEANSSGTHIRFGALSEEITNEVAVTESPEEVLAAIQHSNYRDYERERRIHGAVS